SIWRASSLPDGSPIRVVPPPISTTGRCPCFCSSRSAMICTRLPTCRLSAVQSKPIYAERGPAFSAASSASVSVHWNTKPRSVASWRKSLVGIEPCLVFPIARGLAQTELGQNAAHHRPDERHVAGRGGRGVARDRRRAHRPFRPVPHVALRR